MIIGRRRADGRTGGQTERRFGRRERGHEKTNRWADRRADGTSARPIKPRREAGRPDTKPVSFTENVYLRDAIISGRQVSEAFSLKRRH